MTQFYMPDPEHHRSHRIGWLRAAVLGANDGIISTASLLVGVAAADTGRNNVLIAGFAGLAAGAMAMATGEYVSVSSQADTEAADMELERRELEKNPEGELRELALIYEGRGLDAPLARQVAEALSRHDALGAHMREEVGLTEVHTARPFQAAWASAASFATGGALPIVAALLAPAGGIGWVVSISALVLLAALGVVAAGVGGAGRVRGAIRVVFWGAIGMAVAAFVGKLTGGIV